MNHRQNQTIKAGSATPDGGKVVDFDAGRRAFVRNVAVGAGAGVLAATGAIGPVAKAQAQEINDFDIGNFALNLEYLEAEFYLHAVSGQGLDARDVEGTGRTGNVTGGQVVPFETGAIRQYAQEIAADEENHVQFLRRVLVENAVARPEINLNASFTAAARGAGLVGPNERFNAFANETNFLLASFIFEDVGVTAYRGAAPLISDKTILSAAAALLGVEAYHSGIIRTLLFQRGLLTQANAISDLRDAVDGSDDTDQGISFPDRNDRANLVPADGQSLVYARSFDQILSIVYLGGNGRGGFFPRGVNT